MDWAGAIAECRKAVGPPPRALDDAARERFRIPVSVGRRVSYAIRRDALGRQLRDQRVLVTEGEVRWGHLVMANNALFEPGVTEALPVQVVHDLDGGLDADVAKLSRIGSTLFALQGTRPD